MPNELNLPYQTGLTVTAQLAVGTAYVGSAIACPELPAGSGRYSGDVPGGTAAGTYDVLFKSGGANIGGGVLHWDGTTEVNTRTVNTRVQSIPTNPLLTTDTRLNNLDATISSRLASASYTAPDNTGITTLTSRLTSTRAGNLDNLDASVSSRLASASYTIPPTVSAIATEVWSSTVRSLTDKAGFSLTQAFPANFAALGINASGHISRVTLVDTTTANTDMRGTNNALLASSYTAPPSSSAIASAVETQLSEEFDAIPTASENAAAVRTNLTTELARLDANVSSRSDFDPGSDRVDVRAVQGVAVTNINDFKADVSGIPSDVDAALADNFTALGTAIAAIPTNPLLASNYTAPNNAGITAISLAVADLPTLTEIEASTVLAKQSTLTSLVPDGAIARIDTYTTDQAKLQGLVTGTYAEALDPIDTATPGFFRTEDGLSLTITQQVDGSRRIERV